MPPQPEPIRPISLAEIEQARERIAGTIVRTPLIRLELGPGAPDIRLKLETLQPINAYKLRGAAKKVACLLARGEAGRGGGGGRSGKHTHKPKNGPPKK